MFSVSLIGMFVYKEVTSDDTIISSTNRSQTFGGCSAVVCWYTKLFSISAKNRHFKVIANGKFISSRKSKGLSDETIKPPAISDNSLSPLIDYRSNKIKVKFRGTCLKQPKLTQKIYIVYELGASSSDSDDPTLKIFLFGAVTLTKNVDIDKYQYLGFEIEFNRKSSGLIENNFQVVQFGRSVIIFGADMSFSVHVKNKKKDILILAKDPTQGLEHTLTT